MPQSPRRADDALVTLNVTSNGNAILDTIGICQVDVHRSIGTIASALIVVVDGDMASGEWAVADSETFAPGAEIIIKAGYDGENDVIFAGIVIKIGVRVSNDGVSQLHIHCRDQAVKMTMARRNATYADQTDSGIMAALCAAHGLASAIDATDVVHSALVQYDCSDWDFLRSRAEANALMLVTDGGKITAKAANTSASAALKLTFGIDLLEFEADLDGRGQLGAVTAMALDPKTQTGVNAGDGQPAQAGSNGRMTFAGSALALPAMLIELAGVSERFSGSMPIGSISHQIRDGKWRTTAEFGLPSGLSIDRE